MLKFLSEVGFGHCTVTDLLYILFCLDLQIEVEMSICAINSTFV